jgi:hypothetical protein
MDTPLFGTQGESNRHASAEAIDTTVLVSLAKAHRQENLAGSGRTFHRESPA